MSIAFASLFAMAYLLDYNFESFEQNSFVNAADDDTFENDSIYASYIDSAKLQQQLMSEQKRNGHQTWTMDQYQQYNERKLKANTYNKNQQAAIKASYDGTDGWEKLVLAAGMGFSDPQLNATNAKTKTSLFYEFK